jgi:endonuclease-3 related protein
LNNSFELLVFLKEKNLLQNSSAYWWPHHGSIKSLLGAILTQNTRWTQVETSLERLEQMQLLSLEALNEVDVQILSHTIRSSGFKNQKAKRLKLLANNILNEYASFEYFQENTNKQWLLAQKGIGLESADAILCYTCMQDEMVVDKYTQKLLERFGYEFESYEELKQWCEYGINENFDKIIQLYGFDITLNQIYCRFHGKIVEFMKQHPKV